MNNYDPRLKEMAGFVVQHGREAGRDHNLGYVACRSCDAVLTIDGNMDHEHHCLVAHAERILKRYE